MIILSYKRRIESFSFVLTRGHRISKLFQPQGPKTLLKMVFFDLLDTSEVVYLEDILIFSKIIEEILKALRTVSACFAKQ